MFYIVTWIEDRTETFSRVYKAKDFNTMWRAVYYMNYERKGTGRPAMKQIKIKAQKKCNSEYLEIIGDFDKDMALDKIGIE